MKALGIGLFYNDEDIVRDNIEHLLENNHDLIVWDHGSTDRTSEILDEYNEHFVERLFLPRSFDFYKIFGAVSTHVMNRYVAKYDWISFPESDEILEGPDRKQSYYEHCLKVFESEYDWVQFNNIVYCFTSEDDPEVVSPRERIRRYCIWRKCSPRVYAWRAEAMNVRKFNHNPAKGHKYPRNFNTCHYQIRSEEQMAKRNAGRVGLRRGGANYHFDYMAKNLDAFRVPPEKLHYDSGGELDLTEIYDWSPAYH